MSFRWQHFLDLAEDLSKQQALQRVARAKNEVSVDANTSVLPTQTLAGAAQESAYRTCISRAYYAAFHIVREYVETRDPQLRQKENSHQWVWDQLNPRYRRQERTIQDNGFTMKRARKAADYELEFPSWDRKSGVSARNWIELAEFSILTARRIQKLVDDITCQQ
jgi:uncharacterized protein (UPF0332 family)